jgi:hypothetical protein
LAPVLAGLDPVEFNLIDEGENPVVTKVLGIPSHPGLQRIRLADLGVSISDGKRYQWTVAMVPDPQRRSKDTVAGATIERLSLPEAVASQVAGAEGLDVVRLYAGAGYWYDALEALSGLIDANPNDAVLKSHRAALLEQVGLFDIAQEDRGPQSLP